MSNDILKDVERLVCEKFPTFGGDDNPKGNPIAAALSGGPRTFAAGVSVEKVVEAVLTSAVVAAYIKSLDNHFSGGN